MGPLQTFLSSSSVLFDRPWPKEGSGLRFAANEVTIAASTNEYDVSMNFRSVGDEIVAKVTFNSTFELVLPPIVFRRDQGIGEFLFDFMVGTRMYDNLIKSNLTSLFKEKGLSITFHESYDVYIWATLESFVIYEDKLTENEDEIEKPKLVWSLGDWMGENLPFDVTYPNWLRVDREKGERYYDLYDGEAKEHTKKMEFRNEDSFVDFFQIGGVSTMPHKARKNFF